MRGISVVAFAAACASCEAAELGTTGAPIVNGTPDTTHDAVVAVFDSATSSQCSGTVIAVSGTSGVVLTAAHCLPADTVVMGDDYFAPSAIVYDVIDSLGHPQWNPTDPDAGYDFALLRFAGADGATPVIPALTPAEDQLAIGMQLLEVGYGVTAPIGGENTLRRAFTGTIADLSSLLIEFSSTSGGTCAGDSGGPALTIGTERVAGVTSLGDVGCNIYSLKGRVSVVYDGFIAPFLGGTPAVDAAPPAADAVPGADAAPGPDAGNPADGDGGGCCGAAGDAGAPTALALALIVASRLRRRAVGSHR
jgi:hypothetical protein